MKPTNLKECLQELYKSIPQEMIEEIKSDKIKGASLHFNVGMCMRNDWGLWGKSDLKDWFNSIGIIHPDDMSAIILEAFIADIKKEVFDLDAQVKFYQDYWKRMREEYKDNKSMFIEYKEGKWNEVKNEGE